MLVGANKNIKNGNNKTPWDVAKNYEIRKLVDRNIGSLSIRQLKEIKIIR